KDFTSESFTAAIERAFETFVDERKLAGMRRAAMSQPFDWAAPARDYVRLYARLTGRPALRVASSEPSEKLVRRPATLSARAAGTTVGNVLPGDRRAASIMSIL